MKTFTKFFLWCLGVWGVAVCSGSYAQTPVAKNGQLSVCGRQLCNQYGNPIQLRGMSTHGIQWYGWGDCLTEASLDVLANDWGADILRISLYVQEGGYETDPVGFTAQVTRLIEEATERGMYALVDWHQLDPGDPNANLTSAKKFFTDIANAHKNKNNIIYDVCNEPNGVTWARIKTYADQIIPVIRAIDSDAVVLVGTHGWASLGVSDGRTAQDIVSNPLTFSNIMYTFHFYAKSHRDEYLNELSWAADRLPMFVTEFGSQEYTGDGPDDFPMTQRYIDLMQQKKISWTSWNYSDDIRTGAAWKVGTCSGGPWTTSNLKAAGAWVRSKISSPADDFPGGGNIEPSVSITSPANNATFTAPATVTINATASDTDGTVTKVEFFQGATKLGEDTSSPYSFVWPNVSAGLYSLTAKATDNGGATKVSTAVNINVQSGPSCAPVIASADDGNVPANVLDGSLATRWSANGDGQWIQFCLTSERPVSGVRIAFYNGNLRASRFDVLTSLDAVTWAVAATNLVSSGTSLNLETFNFSPRTAKHLRIVGHGNSVNLWNSYTEVQVVANTPPTVSITSPAPGTTYTAPATVTISASASDADGTISKVEFFQGATKLGEDPSSPFVLTWSSVAAGNYNLTARAVDNEGAITTSAMVGIVVQPAPSCPAVIASADDGNVAANVLDNNFNTRWSASGNPQWIQFCLSTVTAVNGVQIAFFKGNERQAIFDIQLSMDAVAWTTVQSNLHSSGTSLALETFSFAAQNAKYVRILGHGNTVNAWNSFTEVKILSGSTAQAAEFSVASFPNPAGEEAVVTYTLPEAGYVNITLQHTVSNKLATLFNGHQQAGTHDVRVNVQDLSRGVHVIRIQHGEKVATSKLLLK
ncbi:MAG: cellulase family glycosylhydrolase [Bacteroidota bacterium]